MLWIVGSLDRSLELERLVTVHLADHYDLPAQAGVALDDLFTHWLVQFGSGPNGLS